MPTKADKSLREHFMNPRQKASELYRLLRNQALDNDPIAFQQSLKDVAPSVTHVALGVLIRIARKHSESEFLEAVLQGQMPPVKLTQREMEMVNGGGIGNIFPEVLKK